MQKYHVEIGFNPSHVTQAKELISHLNNKQIRFSSHSLTELIQENNCVNIGKCLKDYVLNFNDVFELAIDNDKIEKIGFRIDFDGLNDIVFILSNDKQIITLWINNKTDKHFTLNKSNYFVV